MLIWVLHRQEKQDIYHQDRKQHCNHVGVCLQCFCIRSQMILILLLGESWILWNLDRELMIQPVKEMNCENNTITVMQFKIVLFEFLNILYFIFFGR